jgi:hypothetical protein
VSLVRVKEHRQHALQVALIDHEQPIEALRPRFEQIRFPMPFTCGIWIGVRAIRMAERAMVRVEVDKGAASKCHAPALPSVLFGFPYIAR